MIDKILGIDDKSINKKSTYYGYIFGVVLGVVAIFISISFLYGKHSSTYKTIYEYQTKQVKYLERKSKEIQDVELQRAADHYSNNIELINKSFLNTSLLFFLLGIAFIINFILFKKLKTLTQMTERQNHA